MLYKKYHFCFFCPKKGKSRSDNYLKNFKIAHAEFFQYFKDKLGNQDDNFIIKKIAQLNTNKEERFIFG